MPSYEYFAYRRASRVGQRFPDRRSSLARLCFASLAGTDGGRKIDVPLFRKRGKLTRDSLAHVQLVMQRGVIRQLFDLLQQMLTRLLHSCEILGNSTGSRNVIEGVDQLTVLTENVPHCTCQSP